MWVTLTKTSINIKSALPADIDECVLGSHSCLLEQACYNQPGTYACINSDGSLSSPGSPVWNQEVQTNQIAPERFPVSRGESSSGVRCPSGYKFNLESMVCDGKIGNYIYLIIVLSDLLKNYLLVYIGMILKLI